MKATKPAKSDHPKLTDEIGEGFRREGNEVNEGFLHLFVSFVIFC
jgi:hypothetical protein